MLFKGTTLNLLLMVPNVSIALRAVNFSWLVCLGFSRYEICGSALEEACPMVRTLII